MKFKKIVSTLLTKYIKDDSLLSGITDVLHTAYTTNRLYHNTKHIEDLYNKSQSIKGTFIDYELVCFAILFHDIIYDVNNTNTDINKTNEGLSAEYAVNFLNQYDIFKSDKRRLDKIRKMIIASRTHKLTDDSDINIFLDLDLSSLGSEYKVYEINSANIYLEYSLMDGFTDYKFNIGRMNFITSMLNRDTIFLTKQFRHLEKQARINLNSELTLIQSKLRLNTNDNNNT